VPEPLSHVEDEFHEIQLSGKQLVFLFMATTVVAVVIFLCGVLVGRGVRPSTTSGTASAASIAPAPVPVEGTPSPAATAGSPPPAPPATAEDLSYHKRLQGEPGTAGGATAADEKLKTQEPEPPKPVDPPAAVASAPPPGPEGGWVVQIAALRDRAAADAIVRRLTAKGYPTFMLETGPGTPAPGYRVRVGRYSDRRQAEQIARRLEREEQFRPFITR
jgi:cell division septation protein DedD